MKQMIMRTLQASVFNLVDTTVSIVSDKADFVGRVLSNSVLRINDNKFNN